MRRFTIAVLFFLLLGGAVAEPSFASESTGEDAVELYSSDNDPLTKLFKEKFVRAYENPELWKQAACSVALGTLWGGIDYFEGTGLSPHKVEGLVRFLACEPSWEILPFSSVVSWLSWFSVSYCLHRTDSFFRIGPGLLAYAVNSLNNVFWLSTMMRNPHSKLGTGTTQTLLKPGEPTHRETIGIAVRSLVFGVWVKYLDRMYGNGPGVSSIFLMSLVPEFFPLSGDEKEGGAGVHMLFTVMFYLATC